MAKDTGLTDLGMTAETQSSGVQPTGPSKLQVLLGDAIPRYETQIAQIEEAQAKLASQKQPGILDKLLSPAGIVALLGTAGAGLAGGGEAAAAFGAGGLQGVNQAFAQQEKARQDQLEMLQKQLDSAKKELDTTRQNLLQVWNREPEAFMTPEGTLPVSPEALGYYLTGTGLPITPLTKRALAEMDLNKKNRLDAYNKALQESKSPEQAKLLTTRIMQELGNPSPDPNLVELVASSYGTPEQEPAMAKVLEDFGVSGYEAIIFAQQNGLSYTDPKVWERVKYDPLFSVKLTAEQQLVQQIVAEVNDWAKRHPEQEREVRVATGEDAGRYWETLVNLTYEGRPGDISFALSKIKPKTSDEWAQLLAARRSTDDIFSAAQGLAGIDKLGMTQDEIDAEKDKLSNSFYERMRTDADRVTAERNIGLKISVQNQISDKVYIDPDEMSQGLQLIFLRAREAATQPDGTIDSATYARVVREKTAEMIQDFIDEGRGK